MKIAAFNTCLDHLYFGKKTLFKTKVQNRDGEKSEAVFVEYEPGKEADQNQIRRSNVLWQPDNGYLGSISNDFKFAMFYSTGTHFYGLEDKNGDMLVIAETKDEKKYVADAAGKKNCIRISFIQAHPDEIFSSKNRTYKGLGEALVSSIVKKAKNEKKHCVELKSANENFWAKSGYFNIAGVEQGTPVRVLPKKDFDKYIGYVDRKNTD